MRLDNRIYNLPAITVSVSRSGGVIKHYTCGLSDIAKNHPMDHHCLFRSGIITRTFMAAILLRLADAQALDIDMPLDQLARVHQQDDGLLKLMVSQYPFLKPVTVRELLNNRSGLPSFEKTNAYGDIFVKKPRKKWQLENYLDAVSGSDVEYQHGYFAPPRGQYGDSATNFVVCGLVVKAVCGLNTAESMRDLFRAFDLRDTYYLPYGAIGRDLLPKMARIYLPISHPYASAFQRQKILHYNDNKELQVYDVTSAYCANGMGNTATLSSSADLIRWFHALVETETVVNRYKELLRAVPPLTPEFEGKEYDCFGLRRSFLKNYGEFFWVAANNLGSSALVAHSIDKDLTFVLTTNVTRDYFVLNKGDLVTNILQQLCETP